MYSFSFSNGWHETVSVFREMLVRDLVLKRDLENIAYPSEAVSMLHRTEMMFCFQQLCLN